MRSLHHPGVIIRHLIQISVISLFCYSSSALADEAEIQALKTEIETLKSQLRELKAVKCTNDPKKTKKTSGNPWQSLSINLSKDEVKSLLGKPGRIDKWKSGEAWYYPDSRGGEVDFDANEKVTGWLEP